MSIIPFDITCYNHLHSRFQNVFNEELINEICYNGQLKVFNTDEIIINIGDKMEYFPLIVSGTLSESIIGHTQAVHDMGHNAIHTS